MKPEKNSHGRTIWDFIAEHPKRAFFLFILILFASICTIYIVIKNKYEASTPWITFKSSNTKTPQNGSPTKDTLVTKSKPATDSEMRRKYISNKTPKYVYITKHDTFLKSPTISVKSENQSGGQTAYQITNNSSPEPRILSAQDKQIIQKLQKNKIYEVGYIIGVQDGISYGKQILDYLKSNGYKTLEDLSIFSNNEQQYGVAIVEPAPETLEKVDVAIIIGFPITKK